jgi:hypothetical protein
VNRTSNSRAAHTESSKATLGNATLPPCGLDSTLLYPLHHHRLRDPGVAPRACNKSAPHTTAAPTEHRQCSFEAPPSSLHTTETRGDKNAPRCIDNTSSTSCRFYPPITIEMPPRAPLSCTPTHWAPAARHWTPHAIGIPPASPPSVPPPSIPESAGPVIYFIVGTRNTAQRLGFGSVRSAGGTVLEHEPRHRRRPCSLVAPDTRLFSGGSRLTFCRFTR